MSERRVLVLGGTSWLGGRVAALAAARGHAVTCLARGEAGAPPDGVRFVESDRWQDDAYHAVRQQDWDTLIDVSWQPTLVSGAVAALADRVRQWVYVSSCSVYADDATPDADESAALHAPWTGTGTASIEEYGPAKVACEQAGLSVFGDRALVVRPGLIVGYGDRSDRFGYWPARFGRAQTPEEVVLTSPLDAPCQVLDVDDLAQWLVHCVEDGSTGVFTAVGDTNPVGEVLGVCAAAAGCEPRLLDATDAWLTEHGVEPWAGADSLPLWLPQPDYAGFMRRDNSAAKQAGLRLRPLGDTATAALRWETELGIDRDRKAGLTPAREQQLVAELLRSPA